MFLLPLVIVLMRVSPYSPQSVLSLCFGCLLIIGMPSSVGRGDQIDAHNGGLLRREGSKVTEVAGEIMPVGNRWSFVGSDKKSYRLLENLALQRIVRAVNQDVGDKHWTIDGTLTEFMGENYIQLSRATRTSKVTQVGEPDNAL